MGNHRISGSPFAIKPLFSRVLVIAVVVALFYGIIREGFFPLWTTYIEWGVRVIIAYEILIGSCRTLLAPLLAGVAGAGMYIFCEGSQYSYLLVSTASAWQLMITAVIGALITISRL